MPGQGEAMHNVNGKTGILGIIGHPVGHSLSPAMQNAALAACGLNYIYVPFDVHPDRLGIAVKGLVALGVSGFNVTIPHKTSIIPCLDALDESAEEAGAVNTVRIDNGRLIGYNTDGDGLLRSLADDLGFVPGAGTIILVGAGGAARGALASLSRAGAERIVIVNRTPEKARELSYLLRQRFADTDIIPAGTAEEVRPFLKDTVLLVNTTSLGMNGEVLSVVELGEMRKDAKIYDMVYAPAVTPLLRDAAELGLSCVNGLGMLAGQGELAFKIWTGVQAPPGLMKRVLATICIV